MIRHRHDNLLDVIELIPNRSMGSSMLRFHIVWLGVMFALASVAFIVLGAWPVSVFFALAWAFCAFFLVSVNKRIKSVEVLEVSSCHLNVVCAGVGFVAPKSELKVYLGIPTISWQPYKFELVDDHHPPCRIGANINREDGERLLAVLKGLGLSIVRCPLGDHHVKAF